MKRQREPPDRKDQGGLAGQGYYITVVAAGGESLLQEKESRDICK